LPTFNISSLIALTLLLISFLSNAAIDVTQFAAHDKYRNVKISPSGKYLAISRYQDEKSSLVIIKTDTMQAVNQIFFRAQDQVGQYYWANNERIVIKIYAKHPDVDHPVYYGDLYSVDAIKTGSTTKGKLIFGNRVLYQKTRTIKEKRIKGKHNAMAASWANIVDLLPSDEAHILINARPYGDNHDKLTRLYKLNIYDRNITFVASSPLPDSRFFTDDNGDLVLALAIDKDNKKVVFDYDKAKSSWSKVQSFEYGSAFSPLTYDHQTKTLINIDNIDKDTRSLYRLNVNTGTRELLFNDPNFDISRVHLSDDDKTIYAISTDPGYKKYHFPNPKLAPQKFFQRLVSSFNGYNIHITSNTSDDQKIIFEISNDREPGAWYLYDKKLDKATYITSRNKLVDAQKMLPMQPFNYAARDGVKLGAFITLPAGNHKKPLPAVVLVHGGPFGTRDTWRYDNEVQLLAAKGYVVLQTNFRGSTGRGDRFERSGYRHWGDKIQYDIIDGIEYLIAQKLVDGERVCIMGSSFGAYSAVQASILAPKRFKCAIAASGVYNLASFSQNTDIKSYVWGESFMKSTIGVDEKTLKSFSPLHQLSQLNTALLLVHGGKDKRTPITQARDLKRALDSQRKPYDWLKFDNEGHGIYKDKNRLKYYQKVSDFLDAHNPAT